LNNNHEKNKTNKPIAQTENATNKMGIAILSTYVICAENMPCAESRDNTLNKTLSSNSTPKGNAVFAK
jgi:hypothetical protein